MSDLRHVPSLLLGLVLQPGLLTFAILFHRKKMIRFRFRFNNLFCHKHKVYISQNLVIFILNVSLVKWSFNVLCIDICGYKSCLKLDRMIKKYLNAACCPWYVNILNGVEHELFGENGHIYISYLKVCILPEMKIWDSVYL